LDSEAEFPYEKLGPRYFETIGLEDCAADALSARKHGNIQPLHSGVRLPDAFFSDALKNQAGPYEKGKLSAKAGSGHSGNGCSRNRFSRLGYVTGRW